MNEFFKLMPPELFTFWLIAIPSSIIFGIQTLFTFIGLDMDHGSEVHSDSGESGGDAPFQLFTFRNLIAFLTVFSWSGIISLQNGISLTMSLFIGIVCGLAITLVLSSMFYLLFKMAHDNSPDVKHTIGREATVYLRIPANGQGKINVEFGGAIREISATSTFECPTGSRVKVIKHTSGNVEVVPALS